MKEETRIRIYEITAYSLMFAIFTIVLFYLVIANIPTQYDIELMCKEAIANNWTKDLSRYAPMYEDPRVKGFMGTNFKYGNPMIYNCTPYAGVLQ